MLPAALLQAAICTGHAPNAAAPVNIALSTSPSSCPSRWALQMPHVAIAVDIMEEAVDEDGVVAETGDKPSQKKKRGGKRKR